MLLLLGSYVARNEGQWLPSEVGSPSLCVATARKFLPRYPWRTGRPAATLARRCWMKVNISRTRLQGNILGWSKYEEMIYVKYFQSIKIECELFFTSYLIIRIIVAHSEATKR